jgi:hypothetical protein
MITRVLGMTIAVACGAAAPAAAQDLTFGPGAAIFTAQAPPPGADVVFDRAVDVLSIEPFEAGEPVTGAPYSASIVTEIVQPLADGNRIERRTTSTVARDGRGRVRREQQLAAIGAFVPRAGVEMVTITDPVSNVHYALDRERKVATRMPLPVIKRFEAAAPARPLPGAAGARAVAPRTESLGMMQVDGVMAEGTRTTITIEQGAIGNVAPIDIVSERWYSPELHAVVLSRRSDPRFGETTYRLENIVRSEPAAELFRVPAGYKVEAGAGFGVRTFRSAAPPPKK